MSIMRRKSQRNCRGGTWITDVDKCDGVCYIKYTPRGYITNMI